jgi:hypothetical protein
MVAVGVPSRMSQVVGAQGPGASAVAGEARRLAPWGADQGAATPPLVVFPAAGVVVDVDVVVVCAVPPLVEPMAAVEDEEVVVLAWLVIADVEVAAVELVETIVVVAPVSPVAPETPDGLVGPRLSSGLVVVGMMSGELVGASSETWDPPHAARIMPQSVATPARRVRAARGLTAPAGAGDGRTWGSR